jgi:hypothetical protein
MIWDAYDAMWEEGLHHARAFHREHGHLIVPLTHVTACGYKLGQWVAVLRKPGRDISDAKQAELNELGMVWNVLEEMWHRNLKAAQEYYREHEHLNVPQAYVTHECIRLGNWISRQRVRHQKGELNQEQVRLLEELGICWEIRPITAQWEEGLTKARAFHTSHGHLRVPDDYPSSGTVNLPAWLKARRRNYHAGELAPERVKALEELGMPWTDADIRWQEVITALKAFHAEHGHINTPRDLQTPSGLNVKDWIQNRRSAYQKGKLPADKAKELEALGIDWHPENGDWAGGLADCQKFFADNGHLNIPKRVSGQNIRDLHTWLERRRDDYRDGKLPQDRIDALTACGMRWLPALEVKRQRAIKALRTYYTEHGHLNVPTTFMVGDFNLGRWVRKARSTVREGRNLHPDVYTAFEECNASWLTPEFGMPHDSGVAR